jgi:hypothetical protein
MARDPKPQRFVSYVPVLLSRHCARASDLADLVDEFGGDRPWKVLGIPRLRTHGGRKQLLARKQVDQRHHLLK